MFSTRLKQQIFSITLLLFLSADIMANELKTLKDLQWQHRVIVVFNSDVSKSIKTLDQANADINDRDIVWFIVNKQQLITNYAKSYSNEILKDINNRLDSTIDKVFLLGKDGGIKARSDQLDLSYLFALIDSMPMRQEEMRRKNN